MSSVVIVGAQWGDEGKGKMVDHYASFADAVVRYQGGSNAGHTLVIDGEKKILHLVPSGILREKPICILSDDVVIEPNTLVSEINTLKAAGCDISPQRFKISARAHITMPYHIMLDHIREIKKARAKIGTTGKGIGPTYEDKAARRGIRAGDLLHPEILKERLETILDDRNYYIQNYLEETPYALDKLYEETMRVGEFLAPYIDDTSLLVWKLCKENKNVLFEGAQGVMLDINGGTYPYVTSSHTIPAAAAVSAGISPAYLNNIIGVSKAYTTRVGEGPMPTELNCEMGDLLRFQGGEYGATTGRPRRCGWLDMVCLKYAIRFSGLTSLILTKIDILSGFPEIKVAVAYDINGKRYDEFPYDTSLLAHAKPIYETFPGWKEDLKGIKSLEDLPVNAKNYVNWIVKQAEIPLLMLSLGAQRGEGIETCNPFKV